jgi:hypothetical protein
MSTELRTITQEEIDAFLDAPLRPTRRLKDEKDGGVFDPRIGVWVESDEDFRKRILIALGVTGS